MSDKTLRLAVVIGSVRGGRFGEPVGKWFTEEARRHGGFDVDLVDLLEHRLPNEMPVFGTDPEAGAAETRADLAKRFAAADAFVLVTPEYNHSFPAALKNVLDWFRDEWKAKPFGLVSYGGQGGGIRAAEHLRQVVAELHGVTVRDALSFHNAWELFDGEGRATDDGQSAAAAKAMLNQVVWWGELLREGRAKTPYEG